MARLPQRAAWALLLTALVAPSSAQVQNGQFSGIVTDPSDAVVSNARVTVTNMATGYPVVVYSNGAGLWSAQELLVGEYRITVDAPGFRTATSEKLELNAGSIVRIDFKLVLGRRQETLEVSGAAVRVSTENARLYNAIDSNQIANLPLNGRNVYDLIQYAPGATNVRGLMFENGANTVVNGVREDFNGFLINGLSNKGLNGGPVNQPIQDAVQEFQLVTLNNSAEFGNSAGAITNLVTKSGTNDFHGSGWEFFRNDALDANPFFANHFPDPADRKRTPLHLNQFGATLGGPVRRNKLFFFAAYQGDRFVISNPGLVLGESQGFRSATISAFRNSIASLLYSNFVPQDAGIPFLTLREYVSGVNFAGTHFQRFADYLCPANTDPPSTAAPGILAQKFATLFGVEQADIDAMNTSCPGGSPFPGPVSGTFSRDDNFLMKILNPGKSQASQNLFNGNEGSLRLDYNVDQSNRFFTQFNWARASDRFFLNLNGPRGFLNPSKTATPNFQFSYIRILTPNLLNEFRAGYTANRRDVTVTLPGVPTIAFDDHTLGFGAYGGYPQTFHENIYSYSDLVSVNHAKHNMKAGVEVRRNIENSNWNAGRPSYYFFDPLFFAVDAPYAEGAGVDPGIIDGTPAHLQTSVRHWRNWEFSSYLQDDWKLSRRLTLNLGVRYDLYTRHTELDNLATTFLKGTGRDLLDNITTGVGQIKNASTPCPGNPMATIAGACGPGGFAPAKGLGAGDHNNFGPRIGFAWDLFGNGKTSLRAGFGVAYEGTLYNPLSNTRWNPPYYSLDYAFDHLAHDVNHVIYGPVAGGIPTFLGSAPPGQHSGTGAQATGNISGWDPANPHLAGLTSIVFPEGIRDPYVQNWFLGIQREVRRNFIIETDYVGTAGRKLFRAESVNRVPGALLPEGTCVTDNFGRKLCSQIDTSLASNGLPINPRGSLNPNYGRLRVWENTVNSIYHGLQVSVRKQLSHGLQFAGNYTYSHAIDSGSTWHSGSTTANGFAAGDGFSTDFTLPGLDRGNSIFDIRHRLTFHYVWQIPSAGKGRAWRKRLTTGWQLNGIWSFQSGAHWTPFRGGPFSFPDLQGDCTLLGFNPETCHNEGADYNLDGEANDRPNAMADHVNATHAQWADGFNLPANFFSAPCLGCVGNLGRNTFLGPGYWAADISLFRSFKLSDQVRLETRTEAFNVLNHTNFQLGTTTGPSAFNQLDNPQFGQAAGTFNPRDLQLGLKLIF